MADASSCEALIVLKCAVFWLLGEMAGYPPCLPGARSPSRPLRPFREVRRWHQTNRGDMESATSGRMDGCRYQREEADTPEPGR